MLQSHTLPTAQMRAHFYNVLRPLAAYPTVQIEILGHSTPWVVIVHSHSVFFHGTIRSSVSKAPALLSYSGSLCGRSDSPCVKCCISQNTPLGRLLGFVRDSRRTDMGLDAFRITKAVRCIGCGSTGRLLHVQEKTSAGM